MSDTDCQTPKNDLNRDWPKPAPAPAEWTPDDVRRMARFDAIAGNHNAAIAAEREQGVKTLAERSFELAAAVEALNRARLFISKLGQDGDEKVLVLVQIAAALAKGK